MNPNQKQMIANMVKEGRLAKGLTQKELSGLSNISVRSIQRIENAELLPRSYTLKTLAGVLDLPFEKLQSVSSDTEAPEQPQVRDKNTTQKIILSIGTGIIIILLALAFIAQSGRFPETQFEFLNFSVVVMVVLTAVLLLIWRNKS